MAARKKRALTPVEQLEAALVPKSEWPYDVPDNWCWTRISHIAQMQSGKNVKAKEISKIQDGEHPYECFGGNGVRGYVATYNNSGRFPIVGRQGALCGNVNMADGVFYATEHAVVTSCYEGVDADWMFYALTAMNLNQYATATAQPGLAVGKIVELPIALPPTAEQYRIVDRIEWLFAKLDDAEAELREVIDSSEQRQATILHKALNGELTANWRSEHGISIEHWQEKTLADVTTRVFDGPFGSHLKTKDYIGSGIRVVRLENLRHLFFDDSKQSYVSEEKYEEIKAHTVIPTDIIMSTFISGEMKVCQLPEYIGFAANKADCIGIRPRHDISTRFLLYALASNRTFDYLTGLIHGSTRPRVNTRQIKSIPIQLPCMAEQQKIANILDKTFNNYQRAITSATDALETIGEIKTATLAKALRGELGTNDPDEPSSKELLADIINGNASK